MHTCCIIDRYIGVNNEYKKNVLQNLIYVKFKVMLTCK
jgi:hypothetical protein